jgi:hypothetical protein
MIKGFNAFDSKSIWLMVILLFLHSEDYFDFINADVGEGITKAIFSIVIVALMTYQYKS